MVSLIEKGYVAPWPRLYGSRGCLELFQQGRVATLQYVPRYTNVWRQPSKRSAADPRFSSMGCSRLQRGCCTALRLPVKKAMPCSNRMIHIRREICSGVHRIPGLPEHVRLLNQATVKIPARYSATYEIEDPEISTMMGKLAGTPSWTSAKAWRNTLTQDSSSILKCRPFSA